jgi:hypothetical protein
MMGRLSFNARFILKKLDLSDQNSYNKNDNHYQKDAFAFSDTVWVKPHE